MLLGSDQNRHRAIYGYSDGLWNKELFRWTTWNSTRDTLLHHGQSQRLYVYNRVHGGVEYSLNAGKITEWSTQMGTFVIIDLVEIRGELCLLLRNTDASATLVSRNGTRETTQCAVYGHNLVSSPNGCCYVASDEADDRIFLDNLRGLRVRNYNDYESSISCIWADGAVHSVANSDCARDLFVARDPREPEPHITCAVAGGNVWRMIVGANDCLLYLDCSEIVTYKHHVACHDLRNCAEYYIDGMNERSVFAIVG